MTRPVCPRCGSFTALGQFHCFKCSYKPSRLDRQWCIEDLIKDKDSIKTKDDSFQLPENLIFNPGHFHIDALEWLYKYYIYKETIIRASIGYDPDSHRVFIPTIDYKTDEIINFKMRALDSTQKLKYLFYGKKEKLNLLLEKGTKDIIIVEDHLSGIRCNKHRDTLVLNGTNIQLEILKMIMQKYDNIILWLDSDIPGRQGAQKIIKKYFIIKEGIVKTESWQYLIDERQANRFSCDLLRVNPDHVTLDPKAYTDWDINYILDNEVQCAFN